MNGPLAQQIALTSFANSFLKTGSLSENFYHHNSTFQFCKSVEFVELKKIWFSSKTKEKIAAQNPIAWFDLLKAKGCKKVRLRYKHSKNEPPFEDYKSAGLVGGGGTWLIEVIYPSYSNFWANNWFVSDSNAPDRKIWSVKYGAVAHLQPTDKLNFDLIAIKNELHSTLIQIRDFAAKHLLDYWLDTFNDAINALTAQSPYENYYHKDLLNLQTHSLNTQQILFSAAIAFVFGAMGSWNDLSFDSKDDNALYETISSKLYELVNKAIVAAMND